MIVCGFIMKFWLSLLQMEWQGRRGDLGESDDLCHDPTAFPHLFLILKHNPYRSFSSTTRGRVRINFNDF